MGHFATPIASGDLVDDTTPQLGGDLDVNGFDLVSTSNGDIDLTPNGSGVVAVNQSADSSGIVVSGFDNVSGSNFRISLNQWGNTQLVATSGQLKIDAGNEKIEIDSGVSELRITSADVRVLADNQEVFFGAAQDASITYDGSDMVFDPQAVGSGGVMIRGMKSGTSQASAGASADELWKTSGHATLPDDVVLIGI